MECLLPLLSLSYPHASAVGREGAQEPLVELYQLSLPGGAVVREWVGSEAVAHLRPIPADSLAPNAGAKVPIGAAHDRGLLHRGVWIGVLRGPATEAELLLLQRSDRVVTCPTAWGLVGEHSAPSEAWESTVRRAVREELGVVDIASLGPLGVPVLFKSNYSRDGGLGGRRDRTKLDLQVTALYWVRLAEGAETRLRFDAEVARWRWASTEAVRAMLARERSRLCNDKIRTLLDHAVPLLEAHLAEEAAGRRLGPGERRRRRYSGEDRSRRLDV